MLTISVDGYARVWVQLESHNGAGDSANPKKACFALVSFIDLNPGRHFNCALSMLPLPRYSLLLLSSRVVLVWLFITTLLVLDFHFTFTIGVCVCVSVFIYFAHF